MKHCPSQRLSNYIGNYLITTASPAPLNANCDCITCVVVLPIDVFWSLVHRCRRCKSNATLIINVNACWTLDALEDCNDFCQSANPSYLLDANANANFLSFSTRKVTNLLFCTIKETTAPPIITRHQPLPDFLVIPSSAQSVSEHEERTRV